MVWVAKTCHVGPVHVGAFGYANDVALVAPSHYNLRCIQGGEILRRIYKQLIYYI